MTRLIISLLVLSVLAFTANASTEGALQFAEKTHCKAFNTKYPVDAIFDHPDKNCVSCLCCKTGHVKCFKKKCNPALVTDCGMKFKVALTIEDECCPSCNSTCLEIKESTAPLNCANDIVYFDNDDTSPDGCTGVCGCEFRGHIVPPGVIQDPNIVHTCEQCTCVNGQVECSDQASCPAEKLNCVNPAIDSSCKWYCPDGPTCWRNDEILFANMTYEMDGHFCSCILDPWWPYAACGNQGHDGVIEEMLQKEMCMATPIIPTAYNPNT